MELADFASSPFLVFTCPPFSGNFLCVFLTLLGIFLRIFPTLLLLSRLLIYYLLYKSDVSLSYFWLLFTRCTSVALYPWIFKWELHLTKSLYWATSSALSHLQDITPDLPVSSYHYRSNLFGSAYF